MPLAAMLASLAANLDPDRRLVIHAPVSYTHLRAHETPEHLVCRLLLEKKKLSLHYLLHRFRGHTNLYTAFWHSLLAFNTFH